MRRLTIPLLIMIALGAVAQVPAQPPGHRLAGSYSLLFANLPVLRIFPKDRLDIREITADTVSGELSLDLSTGDEDGEAWERLHRLPFTGNYRAAQGRLEFAVDVPLYGETRRLSLVGYFVGRAGTTGEAAETVLAGIYSLDDTEQGAFLARRR